MISKLTIQQLPRDERGAFAEIIDDVARGLVPVTCASFSELHDYPQELVDLISGAQAIIDGWIGRNEMINEKGQLVIQDGGEDD